MAINAYMHHNDGRVSGVSMKETEEMSVAELRNELRSLGVSERLGSLILREMGEAEHRIAEASKTSGAQKLDPLRTQLFVLKAHGMTNADLTLNRKGQLFIALTTREDEAPAAQSA
jgi:hypothetical protein